MLQHLLDDLLRNHSEIIDPGMRVARQAVNGETDSVQPRRLAGSLEDFDAIFWRAMDRPVRNVGKIKRSARGRAVGNVL